MEIEREIRERSLSSIIEILPPQRQIAAVLGKLDALVLPSTHEGFPNVVLEAMASGIPVLATRVGDVANLIDEGRSGFIVPVDDEITLSERLLELCQLGVQERRSMGARGRRIVEERFQLEPIATQYFNLYQELIASDGDREFR
jgi:glycosyltransferase involved in cell wall biosynthesis